MTRRSFFATLFSTAVAGVGAVLAPRYYPSVDGARAIQFTEKLFTYSAMEPWSVKLAPVRLILPTAPGFETVRCRE